MKDFTMTINQDDIFKEMLYLVQYGDRKLNFSSYLCTSLEVEDYIEDLKNILIKYYLVDYFEDAMNNYLDEIIQKN